MGSLSIGHWLLVAVAVLLLFGRGKISELMGDVAKGMKALKKGMSDDDEVAKNFEPKAIAVPSIIDQAQRSQQTVLPI
jgi:sec-independent protein translocase protein TatA